MGRFSLDGDNADSEHSDIVQSFEALDVEKSGRIHIDMAYMIILGLGYLTDYRKRAEFTVETLRSAQKDMQVNNASTDYNNDENWIQLDTILKVVSNHPSLSRNNQPNFAQRSFQLMDRKRKGYLDGADFVDLERDIRSVDQLKKFERTVGNNQHEFSIQEANDMIETANRMSGTNDDKENHSLRIDQITLEHVLSGSSFR